MSVLLFCSISPIFFRFQLNYLLAVFPPSPLRIVMLLIISKPSATWYHWLGHARLRSIDVSARHTTFRIFFFSPFSFTEHSHSRAFYEKNNFVLYNICCCLQNIRLMDARLNWLAAKANAKGKKRWLQMTWNSIER